MRLPHIAVDRIPLNNAMRAVSSPAAAAVVAMEAAAIPATAARIAARTAAGARVTIKNNLFRFIYETVILLHHPRKKEERRKAGRFAGRSRNAAAQSHEQ
jgi:hypothetical protein